MGAYDGAEVCELVGLHLLSIISKSYNKENVGLYRDDGLAVFRGNGRHVDIARKHFHAIFKKEGLDLEIVCNLKVVNYLDVTFDLTNDTYKPYRKPNDETIYINAKSNHPPNIIKQLPISIEKRLSTLSNNQTIFNNSARHYQDSLERCGYNHVLQYREPVPTQPEQVPNRKRKIIWFNPPFSKNVTTNIGKYFLSLIDRHFPPNHKYRKIFNRNTIKISYSCMPNIGRIINNHNKNILNDECKKDHMCNCIKRETCPLNNQCLAENIVYEATVTSNKPNYSPKSYIGISETTFKVRYANHKKSFNHKRYEKETELSKEVWRLKDKNFEPNITWKIRKKCPSFSPSSGRCTLCLTEKLLILELSSDKNLLNKRDELVTKCRHQNKFKLCNFH